MKFTAENTAILADTDCPSDWDRDDLLAYAQEAARRIQALEAAVSRAVLWVETAAETIESLAGDDDDGERANAREQVAN